MRHISTIAALVLIGFVVIFYTQPAWSDEGHPHQEEKSFPAEHGHQAPHGGTMATVGSHRVEIVVDKGSAIKIFLYDERDNPIQVEGVSGQIHLTFPDKHKETLGLEPSADQTHFSARLKDQSHLNFKAVLSLVIDGKRQNVRLNLKG